MFIHWLANLVGDKLYGHEQKKMIQKIMDGKASEDEY
jgi:hypothetical protein